MQHQLANTSYAVVMTGRPTIHSRADGDENKEIANAKINIGKEFIAWVQYVLGKIVYVLFLYCNSVGHYEEIIGFSFCFNRQ